WSDSLPQRAHTQLLVSRASIFNLGQQWSVPRLIRQTLPARRSALYHSPYYLMPYRTGLPHVVTLHDLIALILPESVSWRARMLFRLTAWAALRASTHVIIGTESARQELLTHFPIDPQRVT